MIYSRKSLLSPRTILVVTAFILCSITAGIKAEAQTVLPSYKLSIFAQNPAGISQPDSIVRWKNSILIGYQNGVAKDGTDGKSSTIVQYSLNGNMQRTFSVKGHNDGLRIIGEDHLWALQNEDANPNLYVIDLESGHQKIFFPAAPHGGGYDDMVVKDGKVFVTASNPNLDSAGNNDFPALVTMSLDGDSVDVEPVLNGNAQAIDIPSGAPTTLNLTDPDSLTVDPRGNIVLDSQADGVLVFIRHPLSQNRTVGHLSLTTTTGPEAPTVDDTAFPATPKDFLLVSDVSAGVVYRIDAPLFGFEPGVPYSASDTGGFVATLNLDTGVLTPIGTGFKSMRGMIFVSPSKDDDDEKHGDDR
jgi:hypothetical protein